MGAGVVDRVCVWKEIHIGMGEHIMTDTEQMIEA